MSTCYHATLQGHSWPTEWVEEDIIQGDNKFRAAYAATSNRVSYGIILYINLQGDVVKSSVKNWIYEDMNSGQRFFLQFFLSKGITYELWSGPNSGGFSTSSMLEPEGYRQRGSCACVIDDEHILYTGGIQWINPWIIAIETYLLHIPTG